MLYIKTDSMDEFFSWKLNYGFDTGAQHFRLNILEICKSSGDVDHCNVLT